MTVPSEFSDEGHVEDDMNDEAPEVESADEYGYVEPPVVPPPADAADQNPGFTDGVGA